MYRHGHPLVAPARWQRVLHRQRSACAAHMWTRGGRRRRRGGRRGRRRPWASPAWTGGRSRRGGLCARRGRRWRRWPQRRRVSAAPRELAAGGGRLPRLTAFPAVPGRLAGPPRLSMRCASSGLWTTPPSRGVGARPRTSRGRQGRDASAARARHRLGARGMRCGFGGGTTILAQAWLHSRDGGGRLWRLSWWRCGHAQAECHHDWGWYALPYRRGRDGGARVSQSIAVAQRPVGTVSTCRRLATKTPRPLVMFTRVAIAP